MLLKDVLFSQGFGTRYDCAAMVASGAVEIAAEVHDDPDEDVETEGLVFRCLGTCLLYTSDAADEEDSVDLRGRRLIKQKKKEKRRPSSLCMTIMPFVSSV